MNATLHRMKLVDCYRQLGLREGAAYNVVKAAYRKLARQYHPDANPGDKAAQEKFVRIAQAYELLMAELSPQSTAADSRDRSEDNNGLWTVSSATVSGAANVTTSPTQRPPTSASASPAATTLEQKLKQATYTKLQTVLQAQRFPHAIALVEGLAQRLPDDSEVRQWQAITYQHWARHLCQTRQPDKAKVYLRKALRVVPDNRKLTAELTAELSRLEPG